MDRSGLPRWLEIASRLKTARGDADRVSMSDVPRSQGWWQASDGKWYAPPSSSGGWQQTAAPPSPYPPFPGPPLQPRTEGTATAALVTAIVALPLCAPLGGIIALILASTASKKIAASGGALEGKGLVTAARVIGWIEVSLLAVILCIAAITLLGNNASTKFAPPP
jgi:hypothetical protein